jgi:hypothetical protein
MDADFPEAGYLYAVSGDDRYFFEAVQSVRSLKDVEPESHASIVIPAGSSTDAPISDHFDRVLELKYKKGGDPKQFTVKAMLEKSPYEKNFFLDTDTYFIDSCKSLFEVLDSYQMCIRQSPCDLKQVKGHPFAYTPYNTGVIVYRNDEEVRWVFKDWIHFMEKRNYKRDQPSFMEAIAGKGINIYAIRNNWNARFPFFEAYSGRVHLLHGRWDNIETVAERINSTEHNRAWIPILESCIHRHMTASDVVELFPRVVDGLMRRFFGKRR